MLTRIGPASLSNCFARITERAAEKRGPALEIVMMDRGISVIRKKFCGRELDDVRPGGLGMHFIQAGVDVVQYSRHLRKNRLRLVKFLPAQTPEQANGKGEW